MSSSPIRTKNVVKLYDSGQVDGCSSPLKTSEGGFYLTVAITVATPTFVPILTQTCILSHFRTNRIFRWSLRGGADSVWTSALESDEDLMSLKTEIQNGWVNRRINQQNETFKQHLGNLITLNISSFVTFLLSLIRRRSRLHFLQLHTYLNWLKSAKPEQWFRSLDPSKGGWEPAVLRIVHQRAPFNSEHEQFSDFWLKFYPDFFTTEKIKKNVNFLGKLLE